MNGLRLLWRAVVSLVTLPVVMVDERVTRINLMRTQVNVLASEANLNVARIGEILCSRGKSDHGRDCLDSVVRAMFPKPVEIPLPVPKLSAVTKTKGDA